MAYAGNIANAILILGALYLHLQYSLDGLYTLVLVLWGLGTWLPPSFRNERKELLENTNALLQELRNLLRSIQIYLERRG